MTSWWQPLRPDTPASSTSGRRVVGLEMEGWVEAEPAGGQRVWRNALGGALGFAAVGESVDAPDLGHTADLQQWCRAIAEAGGGGLIDIRVGSGPLGATLSLIYKRLIVPAYTFTGMFLVPDDPSIGVWTVISGERGTTGVREAVVMAQLLGTGKLTVADYKRSWALDPYNVTYSGVPRHSLRFVSDDEVYDGQFPDHPLSKVRRVLAALPDAIQIESNTAE